MAAAVVANGIADRLGHNREVGDQLVDRLGCQIGMILERDVQIIDIGSMVLVVVDLHRARINMGLKRVEGIGKRRQSVGHRWGA